MVSELGWHANLSEPTQTPRPSPTHKQKVQGERSVLNFNFVNRSLGSDRPTSSPELAQPLKIRTSLRTGLALDQERRPATRKVKKTFEGFQLMGFLSPASRTFADQWSK